MCGRVLAWFCVFVEREHVGWIVWLRAGMGPGPGRLLKVV